MRMNIIYWHMNATQGSANLHPGVNLLPGAICTRMQIVHITTALGFTLENVTLTDSLEFITSCDLEFG